MRWVGVYLDVNHNKHVSLFGIEEVTLKPYKVSKFVLQHQKDAICANVYGIIQNTFWGKNVLDTLLVHLKIF